VKFGLNSWINPPPPNQHVFLVSKIFSLVILIGKKMEKRMRQNVNKKKLDKNLGSKV
jgi:hypothetical protein